MPVFESAVLYEEQVCINYYAYNALNLHIFNFIYIIDLIGLDRTLGLTTVRMTGKGYGVLKCDVKNIFIYYGID